MESSPRPGEPPIHKFGFTVQEIQPAQGVRQIYRNVGTTGIWQPPEYKAQSQVLQPSQSQAVHQTQAYLFDGHQLHACDQSSITDQSQFLLLRITSAYQDHGRIWVHHRDVTDNEADEDGSLHILWRTLKFFWPTYTSRGSIRHHGHSTASSIAGPETRLYATRDNQHWHHKLLPQPYHVGNPSNRGRRALPPCGSLNGDLALLIALLAFTARPEGNHVENTLMHCIRSGSWAVPPGPIGDGWLDQRGLLVKVYLYIEFEHGRARWNRDTFEAYELSRIFE